MGKSTLVARRGLRSYTLATGERRSGQEYLSCPAAMRNHRPLGGQDVSGQKHFGRGIRSVWQRKAALFCPFGRVTLCGHLVIFREC
jgi:hypothetical protein